MADANAHRLRRRSDGRPGSGRRRRRSGAAASARRAQAVGEVCFNTAMTGYQEIMTDPSYAGQIVTFTFPHIGNVGANAEDVEADQPACARLHRARGRDRAVAISARPSGFDDWLRANGRIGLAGVDTRALTRRIRSGGAPNGVIAHRRTGGSMSTACSSRRGLAGAGGHGPRRGGRSRRAQTYQSGTRALWSGSGEQADRAARRARARTERRARTSSRSIMASSATSSAIWSMPGRASPCVPATASFDEVMAHRARRLLPLQRPRRSGRDRRICGAGDPAVAGDRQAAVRHLPRPPAARPRGRREDGEDAPGPSRRQPSGQTARRRPRRDHQHEPRLRGREGQPAGQCARDAHSACSTAALRASS